MAISNDLAMLFAEVANKTEEKKSTSVYGTVVSQGEKTFVKFDGSELLTPIVLTTAVNNGDRVLIEIKNHSAIVLGNTSNPSASTSQMEEANNKILAQDNKLTALGNDVVAIGNTVNIQNNVIDAFNSRIETINSEVIVHNSKIDVLDSSIDIQSSNIKIINSAFVIADGVLTGLSEIILDKLSTKYADIDFANIGEASVRNLFANDLYGVRINGDLIQGNTIKADKLITKGTDGLYHQINVDALGETTTETIPDNGIHGEALIAETVTADKIKVDDLEAFNATIGGFNIDKTDIHSGSKSSVASNAPGTYLGADGQLAIGDSTNYVKFTKKTDGAFKLDIKAESFTMASGRTISQEISDIHKDISEIELTPGPQGPPGPKGEDGSSVSIKGKLDNISQLPTDASPGDGYLINGDWYVWSGSEWNNVGQIQGPQGEQGVPGTPGKDGDPGYTPVKGTDYFTQTEIEGITNDAAESATEQVKPFVTGEIEKTMKFEDGVLSIGDRRSGEWVGSRVAIDDDSVDILDENNTVLASYGSNVVTIGQGVSDKNESSTIKFNGRAFISNKYEYYIPYPDSEAIKFGAVNKNDESESSFSGLNIHLYENNEDVIRTSAHNVELCVDGGMSSVLLEHIIDIIDGAVSRGSTMNLRSGRIDILASNRYYAFDDGTAGQISLNGDSIYLNSDTLIWNRKPFKRINVDYPSSVTVGANASTAALNVAVNAGDGYTPVMVNVLDVPNMALLMARMYISGAGNVTFRVRNVSGSSITAAANTIRFKVLCVRTDFI